MNLTEAFANADDLLALEPEELAGHLLAHLNVNAPGAPREKLIRTDLFHDPRLSGAWAAQSTACHYALMEAWSVLEREALIAPHPGNDLVYFVTRRGRKLKLASDFSSFRHARLFPKGAIHPIIEQSVYSLFLSGDYETAIFKAFKAVEVAVKSGSPTLDPKHYGVDLMRAAFNPTTGPLTDPQEPVAEREALLNLFAGAMGRFKNPPSHRHVYL
jgi:uncharacterized protein (TIGR02391 family)